jgi:hypothetical protein
MSLLAACAGTGSTVPAEPTHIGEFGVRTTPRPHSQPTQSPPPPSAYLDDTWNGIGVYLPFDVFKARSIKPAQAVADGPLYDAVWGSNSGLLVASWQTNHPTLRAGYYLPIGTDAMLTQFGKLGHPLSWWQANHPDWILYECDQQTVAYVSGLTEVPLDISNPDVVSYVLSTAGSFAESNGYSALALDFAEPNNPTGGKNGGSRGCGVWTEEDQQMVWVQKFSGGQVDPAYATAVLDFLGTASQYVQGLSRPLALWGNNSVGAVTPGDPTESQIITDLDLVNDESGFAAYGNLVNDKMFNNIVSWATTVQAEGKVYDQAALFKGSALTNTQIAYAIATYMMEKQQASALAASPYGTYGIEHYYPAYGSPVGTPCGPMYGGPTYQKLHEYVYYRAYSGALAVVNTKSAASYTVNLPHPSYTDAVTGTTVKSPLLVGPDNGFVLLTPSGCG